ncbi:helix-hairpin-helix domain-containing protein [Candidatus Micrarchaeota archaeon]|nr:helix-hairpin-helix domain-containing protein [Candidatus Micrarchaeota archaeon]
MQKKAVLLELRKIPGVGESIAGDLWDLGIRSAKDLRGKNPEKMYSKLCALSGKKIDRCMLYVLRCAVHYASRKRHKPDLLKWWNWKDK